MSFETQPGPRTSHDRDDSAFRARLQIALGQDYELGEMLGRGGMAVIFVARDLRLKRDVAVKTLRPQAFQNRVAVERFQREGRALAKLRHPNILPIFGIGEGEGLTYMITPRIDGSSLRDVIDRDGRLAPRDAVRIAADIARALESAHRLGIIHRDVKPDNILLEGRERHALLTDFGIAKSQDDDDGVKLTAAGSIVGTPRYMSPEQVEGQRDIDGRADIFALGAVLFEVLTGRQAFDAPTLNQLAIQRMTVDPPPVRTIDPSVSTGLEAIVSRCLARHRAERWESAGDLADALTAAATLLTTPRRSNPPGPA